MNLNLSQPLSEDEFDELDQFLLSDMTPDACMDLSMIDGFFAALALTPTVIMPNRWLVWIWDTEAGKEGPSFDDPEEAEHILGYIMRHYNFVLNSIDEESFHPLLFALYQPDGSEIYDADGWCEGFILCVSEFREHWQSLLVERPELVEPMMLLGTDKGQEILVMQGHEDDIDYLMELQERIYHSIPELQEYFRPMREGRRQTNRTLH
ncbi:conserved hypothetical protein [Gammaproteobacteria bacterium]